MSNDCLTPKEQNVISVRGILAGLSARQVLDSLAPETVGELVKIVRKEYLEPISHKSDNPWYESSDLSERMDFTCWLKDSIMEYKQSLDQPEPYEYERFPNRRSKQKIPSYQEELLFDLDHAYLFTWLDKCFKEYDKLCAEGHDPRKSYHKMNRWYSRMNRSERIDYVRWLKKEYDWYVQENERKSALLSGSN